MFSCVLCLSSEIIWAGTKIKQVLNNKIDNRFCFNIGWSGWIIIPMYLSCVCCKHCCCRLWSAITLFCIPYHARPCHAIQYHSFTWIKNIILINHTFHRRRYWPWRNEKKVYLVLFSQCNFGSLSCNFYFCFLLLLLIHLLLILQVRIVLLLSFVIIIYHLRHCPYGYCIILNIFISNVECTTCFTPGTPRYTYEIMNNIEEQKIKEKCNM